MKNIFKSTSKTPRPPFRTAAFAGAAVLLALRPASTVPANDDPPWLCGIHEPGGEQHMLDNGTPGWIVFTEGIGANPNDRGGRDYTGWTSRGLAALVRLNHGYAPDGTLPFEKDYDGFAKRCAGFAAGSKGARRWIIGNETNYSAEWPQRGGRPEPVTAERYAACFMKCRAAIRAVPGHEQDLVIVQGVGVWGTKDDTHTGESVAYFEAILKALGEQADGIALHTYSHAHDPALVTSEEKMPAPNAARHFQFRAYIDFMNAIPKNLRNRPVYITEMDGGEAWKNRNNGWIQAAYAEIDRWNKQPGAQKIRAVCLYRWPKLDQWSIEDKPKVIEDWKEALKKRYRWR